MDKRVLVYRSSIPDRPVIYLNTFSDEGNQVYRELQAEGKMDFNLVTVDGLDWNHDMAPWEAPPVTKEGEPCTGGADAYLKLLTEEIVPDAEEQIQGKAPWRALAGYSLAGLFAVYSIYRTGLFSRIASISGSLWFPGFADYCFSHERNGSVSHIYFSLGDKECRTKNPYLRTVQENTERIREFYRQEGIDTVFQLNPGNHYQNAARRVAAGISWILDR